MSTNTPANLSEMAKKVANNTRTLIEEMRVQANLGKMEFNDYASEVSKELQDYKQKFEQLAENLQTSEGEAKLKLHLGVMEAKEKWSDMESLLDQFIALVKSKEQDAHTKVDMARLKAHLAKKDFKDALQQFSSKSNQELEDDTKKFFENYQNRISQFTDKLSHN